jgi:phosphatidyl-myo-inositol dimannoside synthase
MRVLMLLSDAHGGHGGIAQYNRDVIAALGGLAQIDEIVVLPRLIADPVFAEPRGVRYDRQAARGRLWFIWRAMMTALGGGRFDLVFCGHINLLPVAALAKKLTGAKLVLAVHGTDVWSPQVRWLARRSLPIVDMVLSVSQFTIERMAAWWGDARRVAHVIPNTVDARKFGMADKSPDLAVRYGLGSGPVIMTLGRMAANERAKGFDEIIDLMPRLLQREPGLIYLCVGDGDDRARLQAKADGLGLQGKVVFTGSVSEAEKAEHYRLADAFVLASRGEGFGIVLLEALACGIPVVGSTADATQEALLFGELGVAVDPQDDAALADAILATVHGPKGIPPLLSEFAFEKFQRRIDNALGTLHIAGNSATSPPCP